MTTLNVYQRINEIRKKIAYVQKDAKVQSYRGVTHDQVTGQVRNHLIEFGIVIVPTVLKAKVREAGQTQGGATIIRYEARFAVSFVNSDEPEQCIDILLDAHANDSGDKAPGKALSYAVKFAILKLFNIETGENEESRLEPYGGWEIITPEQADAIKELIEATGTNEPDLLQWLRIERVEQMPMRRYEQVHKILEDRKAKQAEANGEQDE